MSDGLGAVLLTIVVFVAFLFGMYKLTEYADAQREAAIHALCQERYGKEWVGKYTYRNPDMCVNAQGDVKYLQ